MTVVLLVVKVIVVGIIIIINANLTTNKLVGGLLFQCMFITIVISFINFNNIQFNYIKYTFM